MIHKTATATQETKTIINDKINIIASDARKLIVFKNNGNLLFWTLWILIFDLKLFKLIIIMYLNKTKLPHKSDTHINGKAKLKAGQRNSEAQTIPFELTIK